MPDTRPVESGSYPSAVKQLVYSTAPADWAIFRMRRSISYHRGKLEQLRLRIFFKLVKSRAEKKEKTIGGGRLKQGEINWISERLSV